MKQLIYTTFYRVLFLIFLGAVVPWNQAKGQTDIEFLNFQIDDTIVIGSPFEISGTLRNNGTTTLPVDIGMMLETVNPNISQIPFDGDYIQDNFNNVVLLPNETFSFSRTIIADPAHFDTEQNIIVIIWPLLPPPLIDNDSLNNYHYDVVYVKDNGNPTFASTVCDDQTLALGFSNSNRATIRAEVINGTAPFTYLWSTGETSSEILVTPTTTSIYGVTVTDAYGTIETHNHTVEIVDISCANNKVTMCDNESIPSTRCVRTDRIARKLNKGYTLGDCNTMITSSNCGSTPIYGCDCNDGMVSISLVYQGTTTAKIVGYKKENFEIPLEAYKNVHPGDIVSFSSAYAGKLKLAGDTYLYVNDTTELVINTSCTEEIQGETFGDFRVVAYEDMEGYTCEEEAPICECYVGLESVVLQYNGLEYADAIVLNGNQGALLGVFMGLNTGDVFSIHANDLGLAYLEDFLHIEFAANALFQQVETSCSNDLYNFTSDFEVIAYTDVVGNHCSQAYFPTISPSNVRIASSLMHDPITPKRLILNQEENLQVFPNPAIGSVNVRIEDDAAAVLNLALYSIDGKRVKTLFEGKQDGNAWSFDVTNIPEGIYFVKGMTADGTHLLQKVVVVSSL